MVITSSSVSTAAKASYEKSSTQSLLLLGKNNGEETLLGFSESKSEKFDSLETSWESFSEQTIGNRGVNAAETMPAGMPQSAAELKEMLLQKMIEALSGKKFSFKSSLGAFRPNESIRNQSLSQIGSSSMVLFGRGKGFTEGGTMVSRSETQENQSVSYNAAGVVKTADGKTINFNIGMSMSRQSAAMAETVLGFIPAQQAAKKPIDPLVINYGGTAMSLSDEKFQFDLDADGILDTISFAGQGSGFLCLDMNGDGKINDGSELFGTKSGNGFEDLRKYDKDNNGWIDEADEIYDKLRIWSKDKDGNDVLYTLKELDVGAINLNESKTPYTMYDSKGNAAGLMQSSSFFLKDSGGGGMISHIDILV